MKQTIFYIGMAAGFALPFFNIPLILKIRRNKSSKDISLVWVVGAWSSILLMLPQSLVSPDWSFRIFGLINFLFFSGVFYYVWRYR